MEDEAETSVLQVGGEAEQEGEGEHQKERHSQGLQEQLAVILHVQLLL